jgi:Fe-S cluster assembly protein SufD
VDHQTSIDHAKPHGTSTELYKGILDDRARAVFNGEIIVRPDAQKTSAQQTNKNLILSDETAVNSKPQLEIFANDVQCAHGATVGQLDADSLFYMRARGIPVERAARLLTFAFASELIEEVRIPGLRSLLFRTLFSDLPQVEELREHS